MTDLSISELKVMADGRCLLDIPDLSLPTGTLAGIRGPSGAGKTTFLNAISGLIAVKGNLHWGDLALSTLGPRRAARFRRSHMGMIFQDFLLFEELTALENAAIGTSFAPRSERPALRDAAMGLLEGLGLGAMLNRRADTLSGGERQRVATARALAHDPAIILADEPTASLDRSAADALVADLVRLARAAGRTVIAVSHDPHVLDQMDRVLTITEGRLTDA